MSQDLVLVTGGTGFLGAHCILAALQAGYRVRTTLRSLNRADNVRKQLQAGGASEGAIKSVEFAATDLEKDEGWEEACKGAKYVLHVASPFPSKTPRDPQVVIRPARDGTLRVLNAAKAAGTVKRVVVTSSFAAIGYGHAEDPTRTFSEKDWSDLNNPAHPVAPYPTSKTLAERAAWDWAEKEGKGVEVAVVNPVGIFGPVLGKDFASSVLLVSRMMKGDLPGLPQVGFAGVDVRDVADLHLKAMTDPKAAGERFIACADEGFLWAKDIAMKLKQGMGADAKKVPTRTIPNFVLRIVALWDSEVALVIPELGSVKQVTNEKAKSVLGWRPRSADTAIVDCAKSLQKHGVI